MKIKQDRKRYNIGRNIRELRLENGLTQEDIIAKQQLWKTNMSCKSYSHIECDLDYISEEEMLTLSEIKKK